MGFAALPTAAVACFQAWWGAVLCRGPFGSAEQTRLSPSEAVREKPLALLRRRRVRGEQPYAAAAAARAVETTTTIASAP